MNAAFSHPQKNPISVRMVALVATLMINVAIAMVFLYGGQTEMYRASAAPSLHCAAT